MPFDKYWVKELPFLHLEVVLVWFLCFGKLLFSDGAGGASLKEGLTEHKENLVDLPRFGFSCLLRIFFVLF